MLILVIHISIETSRRRPAQASNVRPAWCWLASTCMALFVPCSPRRADVWLNAYIDIWVKPKCKGPHVLGYCTRSAVLVESGTPAFALIGFLHFMGSSITEAARVVGAEVLLGAQR